MEPRPIPTEPVSPPSTAEVVASRLKKLEELLPVLSPSPSETAAQHLRNLAQFTAAPPPIPYPPRKLAGVLILLHLNPLGNLSVTLTTRSLTLRSHPGETALPGGRHETTDASIEMTALREANEEIGLPLVPEESLFHLTTLAPFTSRNMLVVIPSVYLLTTPTMPPLLANPDEVSAIFHLPLNSFLLLPSPHNTVTAPPKRTTRSTAVGATKNGQREVEPVGAEALQYQFQDFVWLGDRLYRMHSFSHPLSPTWISGLTADILIATALIATYSLNEDEVATETGAEGKLGFERWAEGQMPWSEIVKMALGLEGKVPVREQVKKP